MPTGKRQECETLKKREKIKNGEEPSSGKKKGKEAKVSFAFRICEVLGFSDVGLLVYLVFF